VPALRIWVTGPGQFGNPLVASFRMEWNQAHGCLEGILANLDAGDPCQHKDLTVLSHSCEML
jgi:hypothetical protein